MGLQQIFENKKYLLFIFILSFIIRVLFYYFFIKDSSVIWDFDSRVYKQVAEQIIGNKKIINCDGSSHFYRVPGYSIFLALTNFENNFNNSILIQIVLSSFIPILIFYLCLILFPQDLFVAKLVALVSSFNIGLTIFSGLAMSESIFLILFLLFLIYFLKNKIFYSGVFLGLASMFRPVGHYIIFISIFLILFLHKKFYKKLKFIFYILSGWFFIVLPWLFRNYLLTGCLFFTTLPGIHFIKHSAARIYMQANNISYISALNKVDIDWQDAIKINSQKNNKFLNEAEISNLGEKIAFGYFVKYPFISLNLSLKKYL